ncbi:hypothetical protein [Streptomyces sp. N35]|uniref:hypothetical protein n=1 Tax=Streptomyces sp. N35 TaxID=2795730 RepID=UPI0018F64106|nr:hypothetical protein [Streptomyces sp. N35]
MEWITLAATGLGALIGVSAPGAMVSASDDCFRRLRDFRDVVANGTASGTSELRASQSAYDRSLTKLRELMRTDLGLAD